MSKLGYSLIKEIKNVVSNIAFDKNIPTNLELIL